MNTCACVTAQAVNGGSPTYFGIPLPFDLTTLLAIVRLSHRSCCRVLVMLVRMQAQGSLFRSIVLLPLDIARLWCAVVSRYAD